MSTTKRPPAARRKARTNHGRGATVSFWRRWLGRARPFPDHRWRDAIQRSALTINGLTYVPTGATVAALTTSLLETPGGERNWDEVAATAQEIHADILALEGLGPPSSAVLARSIPPTR